MDKTALYDEIDELKAHIECLEGMLDIVTDYNENKIIELQKTIKKQQDTINKLEDEKQDLLSTIILYENEVSKLEDKIYFLESLNQE